MQKQENFLKKSVITILASILLINFTSAYGSYNDFNMRNLLDTIDSQTMFLVIGFIIIFVFLNSILKKVLKNRYREPDTTTSGIISFCISLLAIYGLNKSNFNISNLFGSFGISTDFLPTLISIILIIGFFWFSYSKKERKFKFYKTFLLLGTLILIITIFTDFIYEKGIATILGAGLLLIGLWLWKKWKVKFPKFPKGSKPPITNLPEETPQKQQRQQRATRQRTARQLRIKHNQYSQAIQQIQKNNNGRIPARGTKQGNLRHRYIQAMRTIENLARKQRIKLR